jgi:hypothetical protein
MPFQNAPRDIVGANPERGFMHLVITLAVAFGTALLIGCAEPVEPAAADNGSSARLRRAREHPSLVPDSVWIPPSPVPPIYEEVPLETP